MKRSNVSSSSDEAATEFRDTNTDYSIILGPEGLWRLGTHRHLLFYSIWKYFKTEILFLKELPVCFQKLLSVAKYTKYLYHYLFYEIALLKSLHFRFWGGLGWSWSWWWSVWCHGGQPGPRQLLVDPPLCPGELWLVESWSCDHMLLSDWSSWWARLTSPLLQLFVYLLLFSLQTLCNLATVLSFITIHSINTFYLNISLWIWLVFALTALTYCRIGQHFWSFTEILRIFYRFTTIQKKNE